ncbi:Response regulator protein [hydrothermal vent metagenome]|uniref:Response regulator protein n=1 Tax=hydrothermal vent metagenome TaxID=652676 RepID=A0A3B0R9F0_9ZZZZ
MTKPDKKNIEDQTKKDKTQEICASEHAQRVDQLKTFSHIGKALTSSLDLREILKIVMAQISELLEPKNWSLLLIDQETGELTFEIAIGEGSEKRRNVRLNPGEGIAGWVVKESTSLLIPDVSIDPRFANKVDKISDFRTKSVVCVPLMARGKALGAIELINNNIDDSFSTDDLLLLETLADYTAIAIENSRLFDKVQELTITDDLTGLFNSRYLQQFLENEVERARRYNYKLSMIFMDLDFFKDVNDKHGHLCGSRLLAEVAAVLKKMVRSSDIICRYGGDEFVILLPAAPKDKAYIVAEKIRWAIKAEKFLQEEGINASLTVSIGLTTFPDDAKDKIELLQLADKAMYSVKNSSRDGVAQS